MLCLHRIQFINSFRLTMLMLSYPQISQQSASSSCIPSHSQHPYSTSSSFFIFALQQFIKVSDKILISIISPLKNPCSKRLKTPSYVSPTFLLQRILFDFSFALYPFNRCRYSISFRHYGKFISI